MQGSTPPYKTVQDSTEPYRSVEDSTEPYRSVEDSTGPYRSVEDTGCFRFIVKKLELITQAKKQPSSSDR